MPSLAELMDINSVALAGNMQGGEQPRKNRKGEVTHQPVNTRTLLEVRVQLDRELQRPRPQPQNSPSHPAGPSSAPATPADPPAPPAPGAAVGPS